MPVTIIYIYIYIFKKLPISHYPLDEKSDKEYWVKVFFFIFPYVLLVTCDSDLWNIQT